MLSLLSAVAILPAALAKKTKAPSMVEKCLGVGDSVSDFSVGSALSDSSPSTSLW